jgi:Flp pilus assembly protein TadD
MARKFCIVGQAAVFLVTLTACAVHGPRTPPLTQNALLSGAAFEATASVEPLPIDDVTGIDSEMRAFVDERIGDSGHSGAKLRRLLTAMRDRGLASLEYSNTATRPVTETFHLREGNCLSFTMLFVTLAREAGLDVSYQIVDVPPTWFSASDLVVHNHHINTIVRNGFQPEYVVDFNLLRVEGNYDVRRVSDDYAVALFYSNVGAEALIDKDYEKSFVNLKRSIEIDPSVPDAWANLGLLYSRRGLYEHAESAYLQALRRDSTNRSVLTNLVALYTITGDEVLAASYRKRITHYQKRNPYYHYSLAQRAYEERRLTDALELLDAAIRLKRDEHQFYNLRGLAYLELGRTDDAAYSFIEAREHAWLDESKRLYDEKLEALAGG